MTLEDSENKASTDDPKHSKCRYWNRGFCRKGDRCQYVTVKKIVRYIQKKEDVKADFVKDGTEGIVGTLTT